MIKSAKASSVSAVALAGALCLASVCARGAEAAPAIAITGATLFDATGAAPHAATVIIKDGRIAAVGPNLPIPVGAEIVHADGEALLPGFFDLHTHWTQHGSPADTPQIAAADISHGVTTVDDFNAAPESFAARRQWLSTLVAPHVNLCARISTPGGHGADWADEATTRLVTTPETARAAVESLLPYHPDCLGEVFTDGWRYNVLPNHTDMNEGTLAALDEAAHAHNLSVLTHTVTVEKGYEAARAKVDVIDHSLQDRPIDARTVALMKANHSAIGATLAVYEPIKPGHKPPPKPYDARLKQRFRNWHIALENLKTLYDAGVMVVLGTDSGMPDTPHGISTLHEMELMVEAGLPPEAALMAGTANSAKAMREFADRGSIEEGKRADLVLIKGAPWNDIHDVRNVDRVFLDGRLVFGPGAPPMTADNSHAMPALHVADLVDDFESPRSNLDTLVTTSPDGGLDRSVELIQRIPRNGGGHALLMTAKMSIKKRPYAEVVIPLSRGSVQPVDVRGKTGIAFDLRGGCSCALQVATLADRWEAPIKASSHWQTIRVPFSALHKQKSKYASDAPWSADDLTDLIFSASTSPGEHVWLELDNVRFY